MDNNVSSHAHSNLFHEEFGQEYRSALKKTCWDENVQLKCFHDLSSFFCLLFISACFRLRIPVFKAAIENILILSSDKINYFQNLENWPQE